MGGILWTNQSQSSLQAETYYSKMQSNELTDGLKSQVQLSLSLTNVSYGYSYLVYVLIGEDDGMKVIGMTNEKIAESSGKDIHFDTLFILDYFFEQEQKLLLRVHKSNTIFTVETTVGNVMGSRGQTLIKPISTNDNKNCENVVLSANTLNNNNMSVNITTKMLLEGYREDDIFFIFKKKKNPLSNQSEEYFNVYKSEVKKIIGNKFSNFNNLKIPSTVLCNGDFDSQILLECHSFTLQKKIGEHLTTLNKLLGTGNTFKIGDVQIRLECSLVKEFTFLEYLRGGMQIALTIGIDFTASNGKPSETKSLHYVSNNAPNYYEKAIRACGDIVAYYDYDGLFPVYGYGASLNYGATSHCFPINFNNDDHNILYIDGVLLKYRECLNRIVLSGPTFFAPLINQFLSNVRAESNKAIYHILMILTDGMINDMDATIDALVEASYMPVSVIIIGIGKGDFGNMDILDADENPLVDRRGRKAVRDLVQFVPFYKFEDNPKLLSAQVLEEIPKQVVEYYSLMKMPPGDPISI